MECSKDGGVKVTAHGELRLRKRLKLPERALERTARNAYLRGKRASDFKGRFRKYLEYLHRKNLPLHGNVDIAVYGENIFIFAGTTLITTWPKKWASIG
jgi:hypothetical protein